MAKKSSSTSNIQRTIVSVVSGAVIILIVMIAQFVFGIDILPEERAGDSGSTGGEVITGNVGTANMVAIPGGYDGGWFQLYFTNPTGSTDEATFHDAPIEDALVAAIDSARQTVDAALFQFNSQPVTDALIRAQGRNVRVRMVTDGEYGLDDPEATFDQIELAGIEIVSDGTRDGYMHDKFVVIDSLYVWTGSTNITRNGIYVNNNNSIYVRSSQLAANYTAEFEELFSGSFGKTSDPTIPNPVITVEGTQIETIFESEGTAEERLIELINQASSVRFMALSFTRDDMFDAILARGDQLDVMGIVEASSRRFVERLYCGGVNVKQDGNTDGMLHHKVFIFDGAIVATGSFNFSVNATEQNDENILIIHNSDLARAYLEEFERRWAEAQDIPPDAFDC
jgi:phosphatidylserine/phosphatidylglycerophosphate/cardiolipin synthase-like enzyme